MAAAIKAINAKIRSNKTLDYLCSTHFWGPASNFGIPLAAVMDTQKDPQIISGPTTLALMGYSTAFMRFSMAIQPKNYLLFACHFVNFGGQGTQAYRWVDYWYMGGKPKWEKKQAELKAKEGLINPAKDAIQDAASEVKKAVSK